MPRAVDALITEANDLGSRGRPGDDTPRRDAHCMRFTSYADVERLVESSAEETTALELKESLFLSTPSQKKELLEDLTGMANGGGGTVIFGVAERDGGVADRVVALSDRRLIGVLQDIVRDGVSPPLLVSYSVIDVPDQGFVLTADVEHSALGPDMIEAYGETRYYTRSGTSTYPMREQQVRDAYLLAARRPRASSRRLERP